ncbi:MAG TPA: FGGY family carbohydrate kinase, partial [Longimicrobiales bacterium]|nr:FGGY family carbohydrate kinase [Longimicrobiales bacterium]
MSTPSIIAVDQGTTGSTCLVVAQDGRILGRAYSEFTQYFPRPGWVEHDADEIWRVTVEVTRQALADAGDADVRALGITNQRETVVLWDRETLEPVHPAIVWQDRRTTALCRALKDQGHEDEVRRRTGLVLDPYFSATKIMWLLRERPELRSRAEAGALAMGTVDSWLIARLTLGQVHATDHTNASRTLLYSLEQATWD